jgi:putative addiction module killer protein
MPLATRHLIKCVPASGSHESQVADPMIEALARGARLVHGNFGDRAPVGEGVHELWLFFGPGYRVYFGEHSDSVVVLLCGGDKDSQPRDIHQAQAYWREYTHHEGV